MRYYCTYFDAHYITRGLALYDSLRQVSPSFRLWVLCFDDETFQALSQLALLGLEPIALGDFEDEELLAVKPTRSRVEYYFTCSPSLPLHILNHYPEVDMITYLDSDLYFFRDPQAVYDELGDGSIAIIEHRHMPERQDLLRYGIYNVAWLTFRRDENGMRCLNGWREQCLDWCYDRVEPHRYADQKYLDDWPERFDGVVVLQQKGANLAPWNVRNDVLRVSNGAVDVDGQPLVFYHFQGLKKVGPYLYDPNLAAFDVRWDPVLARRIYGPYLRALARVSGWVSTGSDHRARLSTLRQKRSRIYAADAPLKRLAKQLRDVGRFWLRILHRQVWIVVKGHVL